MTGATAPALAVDERVVQGDRGFPVGPLSITLG